MARKLIDADVRTNQPTGANLEATQFNPEAIDLNTSCGKSHGVICLILEETDIDQAQTVKLNPRTADLIPQTADLIPQVADF